MKAMILVKLMVRLGAIDAAVGGAGVSARLIISHISDISAAPRQQQQVRSVHTFCLHGNFYGLKLGQLCPC